MPYLQGLVPQVAAEQWTAATLFDTFGFAPTDSVSAGAQTFELPSAQPTITKGWTITGWSIIAQIALVQATGQYPRFGLLGKLMASLIVGGSVTPQVSQPFQQPPQPALGNLVTIWDGSQDPPPPFLSAPSPRGVVGTNQQLPQPQKLAAGDQLALGLWLTPAMVAGGAMAVYNVNYQISYTT